jgi:malonyl-CoA O-methyltransferase
MNKNKIATGFNRAAKNYEQHADLQKIMGNNLLQKIIACNINPQKILDLGCATGFFTNKLNEMFLRAKVVGVDIADQMIVAAKSQYQNDRHPGNLPQANYPGSRKINNRYWIPAFAGMTTNKLKFICADIDNLSVEKADLIFSNCTLQWMPDLNITFKNICKILSKDGYFFFSTFVTGTLRELCDAWRMLDNKQHVNNFVTVDEIENNLKQVGFNNIFLQTDTVNLQFNSLIELMQYLKNVGANYVAERDAGLLGKKTLKKLTDIYQKHFSRDNKIIATFNVAYGCVRGE